MMYGGWQRSGEGGMDDELDEPNCGLLLKRAHRTHLRVLPDRLTVRCRLYSRNMTPKHLNQNI